MGIEKIMIIGNGSMGQGIAQAFAENGYEVILNGRNQESLNKSLSKINNQFERLLAKGTLSSDEIKEITDRITPSLSYDDVKNADLVIETVIEDLEIKRDIFEEIDKIAKPHTIFASNTSSLSISELQLATARPDKVIGMHFFNPAPVMQLVEVSIGDMTSKDTIDKIEVLSNKINKNAVRVYDSPGFVVNRILIPMINEAINVLETGVASVEDIDNAMKLGANHPMGPLALADYIGLDVVLAIMEVLNLELEDSKYIPASLLERYVVEGKLGRKTGQGFYTYNH